ncbi:MAG: ABC transporter permease subunit [Clostridia bacterium]|nr:ABC transporter permease subunit [Clostridia bacterium]
MSSGILKAERNDMNELSANKDSLVKLKGTLGYLLYILPLAVLIIDLSLHWVLPNKQSFSKTKVYPFLLEVLICLYITFLVLSVMFKKVREKLLHKVPLLTAAFILLEVWDMVTLKLKLLPLPYFPGPDKVLSVLASDWQLLGISTFYSLRLLFTGYFIGIALGFITGVSIGWNKHCHYWIMPVLKIIGPIPATAWIPIAMTVFPTSFWASVFLIVLAVWFPVTVMTSSGIANVRNAYFEVAKTLGASQRYLIFKVAIPAAFPMIFIGLFMGLGGSFITLIVSEMLGVKAGLGWYINWAQGWAEYSKVYATLIVIAFIFSSLISLLFKLRDRILIWQRGLIKW